MNKILFSSLFSISLLLCETYTFAVPGDEYETLSVVSRVTNPRALRGIYEEGIKGLRAQLGTNPDASGYNWRVPMQPDADLHISLITFGKGRYGSPHVAELWDILSKIALKPHNGYILRPELWTHKKSPDETVSHSHWVHPGDLTLTEKQGDKTQFFDPAVRSLSELTASESADSGHIVLRYATQGTLSDTVSTLVSTLQSRSSTSETCRTLEANRDKFGSTLISHVTIARIMRCQGDKAGIQQEITGPYSAALKGAFEGFRTAFQTKGTMLNPKDSAHKVVPYDMTEIQITSGVRGDRQVLHTLSSK